MTPNNKSRVPVGTMLGDKFKITREIGRGGMAAVYEAENTLIGKRVAVKILAAELVKSRVVTGRFLREARAMAAIRSPYICEVYDSGEFDDRPFMVLELLEGESLYDLLTRVRRLDADLTLKICSQCAQGLQAAHEKNVIHRDLKPENIFLTKGERGIVAKLLDFGLAKFYDSTGGDAEQVRLTREGALFGTPAYMSPEQAKGIDDVDHRTDLWALGCIVYECLTGKTVWNADQGVAMILAQIAGAPVPRPTRLRPDLPKTFDEWFQRALDRDPNKRFQTVKEWTDSLERALKPPPGAVKAVPLHSMEEGEVVDELVRASRSDAEEAEASTSTVDSETSAPDVKPANEAMATSPPPKVETSIPPPRVKSRAGGAIVFLLGLSALAVVGYAVWLYVVHPPSVQPLSTAELNLPFEDAGAPEKYEVMETEPFALQIGAAQERLAKGETEDAFALFREAFNNGGHRVSRALLSHAGVGTVDNKGKCKLTGLGRPRPYDTKVPVGSRPTIALSPSGAFSVWADTSKDANKRRAFGAVTDVALRRVSPVRALTPESEGVRHPQLLKIPSGFALVYWEGGGAAEPGVYVRRLDRDGRIAGPSRRVSEGTRGNFYPTITAAKDGTFWVMWQEEVVTDAEDIVARRLDENLEPKGKPVRLTAYRPTKGITTAARKPHAAVAHGKLHVVYGFERNRDYRITLLSIPLGDVGLAKGVGAGQSSDGGAAPKEKKKKGDDQFVGKMQLLGPPEGKNTQPRIACATEGCFVVWDDESAGALASFIDRKTGEAMWHRELATRGSRPAVAVSDKGAVAVAFFDSGRLKLAALTRDGLDDPSVLSKVSGYQPYSAIVPGEKPGQWYISWRDYESGRLEAFAARAQCP